MGSVASGTLASWPSNCSQEALFTKRKKRFTLIPMKDLFISPGQVHGLLKTSPLSLVLSKSIDRKADRDITTYRRDK